MSKSLSHHGILGMKWGVRRYQNPDGTLTPEGKKRYRQLVTPNGEYTTEALRTGFDKKVEEGVSNYVLGRRVDDPFVYQVIMENKETIDATIAQERARQAAMFAQNEAERINRQNASLAISGGTNPFLFG